MKRHSMDMVSLVFGLIFAALVAWWALDGLSITHLQPGWIVVVALVVAGLLGLASTLSRRRAEPVITGPAGETVDPGSMSGTTSATMSATAASEQATGTATLSGTGAGTAEPEFAEPDSEFDPLAPERDPGPRP